MKLTFLGTGTSTGVPQIGCNCPTCKSEDSRDKRLRCSALLELEGKSILIDCGPDLRTQLLTNNITKIDAMLLTHSHYDHVGGIDDMRPFCYRDNQPYHFPTYCQADVADDLRARVPYCFREKIYPGVPTFNIHDIKAGQSINVEGIEVMPVRVWHYKLPILGFKIGNLAYITDAKTLPEETLQTIRGIDTLVINALRPFEHMSHMSLQEALAVIDIVSPRKAYLTHLSHDMPPHSQMQLPNGVYLAYDNLQIDIP